jgi:hypothetical protein
VSICARRAETAHAYLTALSAMRAERWTDLFASWSSLAIHERLVLVHPDWIRDAGGGQQEVLEIQGPRGFRINNGPQPCSSSRLWGYGCPLESPCQYDHLWPYALGGPTKPGNAVPLCRHHNALKGVDIHAYPWEEVPFPGGLWIDNQVALMAALLRKLHAS